MFCPQDFRKLLLNYYLMTILQHWMLSLHFWFCTGSSASRLHSLPVLSLRICTCSISLLLLSQSARVLFSISYAWELTISIRVYDTLFPLNCDLCVNRFMLLLCIYMSASADFKSWIWCLSTCRIAYSITRLLFFWCHAIFTEKGKCLMTAL